MSSYRGADGAWDGGPPGAEAEYATQQPYPPAPRAMPTTDPWTGVSYTHYGAPPTYDYQTYASASYGYTYDSSYYQSQDGYYANTDAGLTSYPTTSPAVVDYRSRSRERDRSRSPESRSYDRHRSYSRSVSPYERDRAYSNKRDTSYDSKKGRSRSRSKSKRGTYSSSDRSSSRSRSYSRTSLRNEKKRRRSTSSRSSASDRSYKKKSTKGRARDVSSPVKSRSPRKRSRSDSHCTPSPKRSISKSPRLKADKESLKVKDGKSNFSKEVRGRDKKQEVTTPPPKKRSEVATPPLKGHKKSDRLSVTPPRSYKKHDRSVTPPRSYKFKEKQGMRKGRDSSVTPPKSYARSRSSSSSKSRSRSRTPRRSKRKHSRTPKAKRSSSRSSSASSGSSHRSRSKSTRRTKRKSLSHSSRSKSRSRRRSMSKSRSPSPRQSKSKGKKRCESPKQSQSRSKSRSPRNRSESGSGSEDERRGQFTVEDRKRFWKLHRTRQEEREKVRTPPKEVKPPPGAAENTKVDDIEYGVPPEVEGPNFADLLPTADQVLQQTASTSKSKNIPIPIKNDGSFLEMFKKMQEETKKVEEVKKPEIKKPLPFIGKRRGGRVLKTGLVKKAKAIDEQTVDNTPKDAWSLYMQEVKKYRETSCEEERKTRPLVK